VFHTSFIAWTAALERVRHAAQRRSKTLASRDFALKISSPTVRFSSSHALAVPSIWRCRPR
jgi:hypothetical protein